MMTFRHNTSITAMLGALVLIIGVLFGIPATAGAQAESITLSSSPQFPEPNQSVTISITSRLVNLNDKQTVWRQDGEVIRSGTGIQEVTIPTGEAGETTIIRLQTSTDSEVVQKTLEITPVAVDLVWEAEESYTPSFYAGKALHPGWGSVRITAIPHIYRDGRRINREALVYTWKYNGLVHGSDSGRGENSFVVNAVPREGNRVSVEIETAGGGLVARESLRMPIYEPEIVFYQYDPLLGLVLSEALDNEYTLEEDEITLQAVPYFYLQSTPTASALEYNWEMNNQPVDPSGIKNSITLRQQGDISGQASVTLEIDDTSRLFPAADTYVKIIF